MPERKVLLWAGGVLAGFLVVGVALLVGSALFGGPPPAKPVARPTPSATTSALPTTAAPQPSSTPTPDPYPTVAAMKSFVVQYLDTVVGSPAQGWARLTPRFRQASGGFAAYSGYWSGIVSADATDFQADPVAGTVRYDVTYTHRDGSVSADSPQLHLLYTAGEYSIDGED